MYLEICPKCAHILSEPASQCPHCGVIFAKVAALEQRKQKTAQPPETGAFRRLFLQAKAGESGMAVAARTVLLVLLILYGLRLIMTPLAALPAAAWLLHSINLVFHEAGHILFSPLGRFLQVLGGSLGQLLVPAVVMIAFVWQRDRFGAAVGLWWLGESLLDLAPYINDARAGQLPLLGGVTGSEVADYHDWEVLLTQLGLLEHDQLLARLAFAAGSALMLLAMLWGSWLLWQGWSLRRRR